jgi:hypothetical protein
MVILHESPYGSVPAKDVPGTPSESEWLKASTSLRLEHELTHLAMKRILEEMRLNLLDELIADCMGMLAALGLFDATLFRRCLGIDNVNGRWKTYTTELSEAQQGLVLRMVMSRACELEQWLGEEPWLGNPAQAMTRLQWLCQQRLDQPISRPPHALHGKVCHSSIYD